MKVVNFLGIENVEVRNSFLEMVLESSEFQCKSNAFGDNSIATMTIIPILKEASSKINDELYIVYLSDLVAELAKTKYHETIPPVDEYDILFNFEYAYFSVNKDALFAEVAGYELYFIENKFGKFVISYKDGMNPYVVFSCNEVA